MSQRHLFHIHTYFFFLWMIKCLHHRDRVTKWNTFFVFKAKMSVTLLYFNIIFSLALLLTIILLFIVHTCATCVGSEEDAKGCTVKHPHAERSRFFEKKRERSRLIARCCAKSLRISHFIYTNFVFPYPTVKNKVCMKGSTYATIHVAWSS